MIGVSLNAIFAMLSANMVTDIKDKESARKAVLMLNESLAIYSEAVGNEKENYSREKFLKAVGDLFDKQWQEKIERLGE